jgi:putative FmdB family regulatory protein
MPVYEYVCKGCGHEFEREQRISDPPVKKCPGCGAQKARRQISRTSFVLKGGGWYSDLYAAPKADAGAKKDEAAKPAAEAPETKAAPAAAAAAESGPTKSDPPPKKGGKGKKAAAA